MQNLEKTTQNLAKSFSHQFYMNLILLYACYSNQLMWKRTLFTLRGHCTSYQKLACFVRYLKIINNILKNKLCIL